MPYRRVLTLEGVFPSAGGPACSLITVLITRFLSHRLRARPSQPSHGTCLRPPRVVQV